MKKRIMSLKKLVRLTSFVFLFCLFAWYSQHIFGNIQEDMLIHTWNFTFHKLDESCIYWITLRMAGWICVYLHLLQLENGFSIYLFLHQRSFLRVFARMYIRCIGMVLCYYGLGTLTMAIYHGVMISGVNLEHLLWQNNLWRILIEECLSCLSFCLVAYLVHCIFRKAEIGFLTVLTGRLLLGFMADGMRLELPVQLVVNFIMIGIVFCVASHNLAEKIGDV